MCNADPHSVVTVAHLQRCSRDRSCRRIQVLQVMPTGPWTAAELHANRKSAHRHLATPMNPPGAAVLRELLNLLDLQTRSPAQQPCHWQHCHCIVLATRLKCRHNSFISEQPLLQHLTRSFSCLLFQIWPWITAELVFLWIKHTLMISLKHRSYDRNELFPFQGSR